MRIGLLGLALAFVPSTAFAESCLPYLSPPENNTGTLIHMTTLNKNGVGSFSIGSVVYRDQHRTPSRIIPDRWSSQTDAPLKQFFSDRAATPSEVGFDPTKSDQLSVSISVAAAPEVEITLESWGNSIVRFTGTCSAGGVIHGSTADVDYLITIHHQVVG